MKLECDGVHMQFGDRVVLRSVYAHVEVGSITALFGRNGAGKSCLLRIMFGSLRPQEGSVRVDGQYLEINQRNQKSCYLPQGALVPAHLRVGYVVELMGLAVNELTSLLPSVKSLLNDRINQLAAGERRMIETFLVVNSSQPFCLLDEPFTGLAPVQIEILSEYIREAAKQKGILISDHLYHRVLPLMNLGYLLSDGYSYKAEGEHDLMRRGYLQVNDV